MPDAHTAMWARSAFLSTPNPSGLNVGIGGGIIVPRCPPAQSECLRGAGQCLAAVAVRVVKHLAEPSTRYASLACSLETAYACCSPWPATPCAGEQISV